jgi:hypothetical protein
MKTPPVEAFLVSKGLFTRLFILVFATDHFFFRLFGWRYSFKSDFIK